MAARPEKPLVVITGPTASGKTSLAIKLAERFGGEIVCADSRTVYKGMDIGTAKPTAQEQKSIVHWGLDLVDPGQRFTAADFKKYAEDKIKDIRSRGKVPFLVGGTGLYVDAVLFDFNFAGPENSNLRAELAEWSIEELHKYCKDNNILLPSNYKNRRHLIRNIERNNISAKRREEPIENSAVVAITTIREMLRAKIGFRAEQIISNGVVNETTFLARHYGWENESMTGNIYPLVRQYLNKEINIDELKQKSANLDWQLAKRQLTWLRRNPYIAWGDLQAAEHYLSDRLENK